MELCNGLDEDDDGRIDERVTQTFYADTDGDGFGDPAAPVQACAPGPAVVADATDCDDLDPLTHPLVLEACDGLDNDCDGLVDDADDSLDPTTGRWFFRDQDGDGFGDAFGAVMRCEPPSGFVAVAGDCDDHDPDLHPATTWYLDWDQDGHGDPDVVHVGCAPPAGYVATGLDCRDGSRNIHPDAVERCNGADDDCDGLVDDADDSVDPETYRVWHRDADGDGFGSATDTTLRCTVPSGYVGDDTDCDDTTSALHPDALEVCFDGIDNNCDGVAPECTLDPGIHTLTDADLYVEGTQNNERFGQAHGTADLNGDGRNDLIVGSPDWDHPEGGSDVGRISVFFGPLTATGTVASYTVAGDPDASSGFGSSIENVGDVDGDGFEDVLVADPAFADGTLDSRGAAWLFLGSGAAVRGDLDHDALSPIRFEGAVEQQALGSGLGRVGDVNGDGFMDLAVGASGDRTQAQSAGAVYLFYGGALTGDVSVDDHDVRFLGSGPYTALGRRQGVAVGDVDADGVDDLLLGQFKGGTSWSGTAHLFHGSTTGWSDSTDVDDADATIHGSGPSRRFGEAVRVADLDGDGYDELAVGEPQNGGAVYLLAGGPSWSGTYSTANAFVTVTHPVADADMGRGFGVGDLNADRYPDLSFGEDVFGTVYVEFGPVTGGTWTASSTDAVIGGSGGSCGYQGGDFADLSGDGYDDLVFGCDSWVKVGRVYLFEGGAM